MTGSRKPLPLSRPKQLAPGTPEPDLPAFQDVGSPTAKACMKQHIYRFCPCCKSTTMFKRMLLCTMFLKGTLFQCVECLHRFRAS